MVVSKISWNKIIGFATFIGMSLVAIPACESDGLSDNGPINSNTEPVLMPSELWTADADSWLDSYLQKKPNFIIYSEFGDQDEIEIFFDSSKIAYRATIISATLGEKNYFFDNERLIYSQSAKDNSSFFLAAYANNEPFAAALGSKGNWEAINPEHIQEHRPERRRVVEIVRGFQDKEKALDSSRRINKANNSISGSIHDSLGSKFYLNARQGDLLSIKLESESPDVYFTTRADNASKMEHKSWSGKIQETGDVVIEVYSLDRIEHHSYTLTTRIIAGRSQVSSPKPSVAQANSFDQ